MNEQYRLFPPPSKSPDSSRRRPFVVVDLGCSPGGWTQASLQLLGQSSASSGASSPATESPYYEEPEEENENDSSLDFRVLGVDLIPTEPVLGARFICGDFLDVDVQMELQTLLDAKHQSSSSVDLVLSDMAPNIRGNRIADIEASLELCRSVLAFAERNLRSAEEGTNRGGSLVIKHFAAPEFDEFRERELAPLFRKKIRYTKPEASRSSSSEAYFVCQDFRGR